MAQVFAARASINSRLIADIIVDEMEFTPEFEHLIRQAKNVMSNGQSARVREARRS